MSIFVIVSESEYDRNGRLTGAERASERVPKSSSSFLRRTGPTSSALFIDLKTLEDGTARNVGTHFQTPDRSTRLGDPSLCVVETAFMVFGNILAV